MHFEFSHIEPPLILTILGQHEPLVVTHWLTVFESLLFRVLFDYTISSCLFVSYIPLVAPLHKNYS